jgi:steroid 5-alpha reductase family enzyme
MTYFFSHLGLIFCFMVFMFMIATYKQNNGLVDIGWGAGFVVVSMFSLFLFRDRSIAMVSSQGLITLFVFLWGTRLAVYLFIRNWGKVEDWRYAKWRQEWGKWVILRSFFQVFMLQGLLMFVILLPIILANNSASISLFPKNLSLILVGIGIFFWCIGFYFQAVAIFNLHSLKRK